jgi:phospholipase C
MGLVYDQFQAIMEGKVQQRRMTRRRFLGGTAGAAAALGLAAAGVAVDPGSDAYGATAGKALGRGPGGTILGPGSRPFPHLPVGEDTMPKIEHIVILMMENHSFDDHLGMLGRGDGLTLGPGGKPVNYNPATGGGYVRSFHNPNTCGEKDSGISQSWDTSHLCWDGGRNLGFAENCSGAAMGYWTGDDLPFYYDMASRFPIGDRYFCSVMAQTYPNRRFLIAATALGDIATNASGISQKDAPNGTIFDRLNDVGVSWKDYFPDLPTAALFFPVFENNPSRMAHFSQFFVDAQSGNLPAVSLVDPYWNYSEETNDISIGEAYAAEVINAVLRSPNWHNTALFWVYDEHGGWYDHVPPVPAIKPDTVPPALEAGDVPGAYDYTGFRVPCCVVSPWAKKDYVSHQVFDHTSILRFIETKWNLPAMTYRDANARDMLDFFDFSAHEAPFAEAPKLAAPKNPFSSWREMPANSGVDFDLFHPISEALPAGSLPPAIAKLNSLPHQYVQLMADHEARIQVEVDAQNAELAGVHPSASSSGLSSDLIVGGVAIAAAVAAGAGAVLAKSKFTGSPPAPVPASEESEG